jgi:hypothetical protein
LDVVALQTGAWRHFENEGAVSKGEERIKGCYFKMIGGIASYATTVALGALMHFQ